MPFEELVVEAIVPVQQLQVLGQRGRTVELINVEEGMRGSYSCIILHTCPHHNWNDTIVQSVGEELFCDIVLAVGVLKGKVELVVLLQHLHAVTIPSGAFQAATAAIYIHLDMFCQLSSIFQTSVPCITVRNEPSNHLCLVGSHIRVEHSSLASWLFSVSFPLGIGSNDS